jgi:hypothetical protein
MKHFAATFGSSLGALCLALFPAGCIANNSASVSDDGGPGLPSEDGSAPLGDATLGDGSSEAAPPSDAPSSSDAPSDAGADAADAAPEPLVVVVTKGGAPEQGVSVVFDDATGAYLSTATTDAAGTVSQIVTAGSQVSVLIGTTLSPDVITFEDVAPGQTITVADTKAVTSATTETVLATLPAATAWDASTGEELVYAGNCESSAGTPLALSSTCVAGGVFPLLARAFQFDTNSEIGYTFQKNNVAVPDAGLPEDGGPLAVTMTQPWTTSSVTQTITAGALPAGLTASQVSFSGGYVEIAGGVPTTTNAVASSVGDAGFETYAYPVHTGFPDAVETAGSATVRGTGNEESVLASATYGATPTASQTTQVDLSKLPVITASTIDTADAGTIARPTIAWTTSAATTAAAGVVATFEWSLDVTDDAGSETVVGAWTIVAPATTTSVHAPALPAALSSYAPSTGATTYPVARVVAVQSTFFSDYAGLLAAVGSLPFLTSTSSQTSVPTLAAPGTVSFSGVYEALR